MERLIVLGSSGSIGTQTLDVCRKNPDKIRVTGLVVHSNCALVAKQAREFGVKNVVVADVGRKDDPEIRSLEESGVQITFGPKAIEELVREQDVDIVLNALVGEAGLRASYDTLEAGHRLALANKESLVVGGDLIMPKSTPETLLPVDSEHGAIYQCLRGEKHEEVACLWVTASGGPFRGFDRAMLESVTAQQALAHPTWKMGPKITIDSSTLMNKGLEVIEAHHLFSMDFDHIKVVVQPQSCIHSMVEYRDGSVKAHLGVTDMRIPIQYALSYPQRWNAPVDSLDFTRIGSLDFESPDVETFRCLSLAIEAGRRGGTLPAVLNAANEVAVGAFLSGKCRLTDIDGVVEATLEKHDRQPVESLDQLEEIDGWARALAREYLQNLDR